MPESDRAMSIEPAAAPNLAPDFSTLMNPSATTQIKLQNLIKVKNSLIGHRERKIKLLQSGFVPSLVILLAAPDGEDDRGSLELSVQAAAILGALSLPTPEALQVLLEAKAHQTVLNAFLSQRSRTLPTSSALTLESKFFEALLRALKILYCDLVKVVGPRAWGTSIIGASVSAAERKDVSLSWATYKGKEKETEVSGDPEASSSAPAMKAMATQALEEVFKTREVPTSSSASGSSVNIVTSTMPSRFLDSLLSLLVDLSYPDGATPYPNRLRLAEHICAFLAGTVRLPEQRDAILGEAESAAHVTVALFRLIEHGNGKIQESALEALSALTRDYRMLGVLFQRFEEVEGRTPLDMITDLTQSPNSSLRLAATTCRTVFFKTMRESHHGMTIPRSAAEPLVGILLSLMTDGGLLRAQAAFTFAYLIADSDGLQSLAIKQKCLEVLKDVLEQPSCIEQPYPTPDSVEEAARTREGALLSIACLSATCEPLRHQVLSAKLLPIVVESLTHSSTPVKAAACHVIRGLARSVNVLRMALIETSAAKPIYDLLDDKEDLVVKTTAAAVVSNLVLEFSPMRQPLIELGSIDKLCHLAQSEELVLRLNALYALKNSTYQSNATFKRDVAEKLGWDFLAELVASPETQISLQALGILRNFSCPYNEDHVQGKGIGSRPSDVKEDVITGLSEIGEEKFLGLLEDRMDSKWDGVVEQAMYVIVNAATTTESARLAIMAQAKLVRKIILHLSHSDDRIRVAAVWVFINLCHYERTGGPRSRRPHEIVARLRAMGVEVRLKQMMGDTSLDVRERVVGRPIPRHPDELLAPPLDTATPPPKPPLEAAPDPLPNSIPPFTRAPPREALLPQEEVFRRLHLGESVRRPVVVGSPARGSNDVSLPGPTSPPTRSSLDPADRAREFRRRMHMPRQSMGIGFSASSSSPETARTSRASHINLGNNSHPSPGRSHTTYREASVQAILDAGRRYNSLLERDRTAVTEGRAGAGLAEALRRQIGRNSNGTWTYRSSDDRARLSQRFERLRDEVATMDTIDPREVATQDESRSQVRAAAGEAVVRRGGLLEAVQRLGESVEALSRTNQMYSATLRANRPPVASTHEEDVDQAAEEPVVLGAGSVVEEDARRRERPPFDPDTASTTFVSLPSRSQETDATLRTARNALRSAVGFAERLEIATRRLARISSAMEAPDVDPEDAERADDLQRSIIQLRSVSNAIDRTLGEDFASAVANAPVPRPRREHPLLTISNLTSETPSNADHNRASVPASAFSTHFPHLAAGGFPASTPTASTLGSTTAQSPTSSGRVRNPFRSALRPEEESIGRRRTGFTLDRNGDRMEDREAKDAVVVRRQELGGR